MSSRVPGHVRRGFKVSKRTGALRVNDSLGYTFTIEMRELFDQKIVLKQNRTAFARCQGMFVTRKGNAKVICQCLVSHSTSNDSIVGMVHKSVQSINFICMIGLTYE